MNKFNILKFYNKTVPFINSCKFNNNNLIKRSFCTTNHPDHLSKKFNEIEEAFDFKLPPYQPIIIRLDGCSFSNLSKKTNLNLPHDQRFHESMKLVSLALGNHFKGTKLIYSFSDEINLLVWNHFPDSQVYSNRIQKLNSIASSIASVTFSNSLSKQLNNENNEEINSFFDSRAFVVQEDDIGEYFLKRYKRCYSNCLTSIISHYDKNKEYNELKKKETENNTGELSRHSLYNREKFIQNNLNIKLSQYPEHFRHGIIFYKNQKSGWEMESFPISLTFINNLIR
ncbi:hypothetical protein DICPUDRAFT_81535 [Dictyostelium purpureum]|uniref:tRNAHis guanylyltransferase catalytic domain-containing protein n=1 Tax=Dictyostelium purpureum TaxID=5786 RepID=F0ZTS6_DICPU|nr:uncharacterized protein DICPUDRAFT_81535 [Dictyostelium purpureum]EGC32645.1 hypothetical protein DICPUDRAFT_81535 [Dictyostelium purpureum]|eukprot:XP_003290814.1 hypothetical protein DICPUDRAFT_81535 [Dictyostelium purpureum]